MRLFLLLFIAVPIIEMLILIKVGGVIGAFPTVTLVLLTAVVGLQLLRQQGLSTLLKAQEKIQQGTVPATEMAEGILLAVGGVLLLTPGFFTDVLGLLCLLPVTRKKMVGKLLKNSLFSAQAAAGQSFYQQRGPAQGDIIEGEFTEEPDKRIE